MLNLLHCFRLEISNTTLKRLLHRFGWSLLDISILSICLILAIKKYELWNDRLFTVLVYYLSTGACLSLALQLWGEEVESKRIRLGGKIVIQILWVLNALYLYTINEIELPVYLCNGAICSVIGFGVFSASFFKCANDLPFWNHSLRLLTNGSSALLIGGLLYGGTALLFMTLEGLFELKISGNVYWYTAVVVCLFTLPCMLFLHQMPPLSQKRDYTVRVVPLLSITSRYLLKPLIALYLIVLYAYAIRILVLWQLPKGWVSNPVSWLMFGIVLLLVVNYPEQMHHNKNASSFMKGRTLPLLPLPLLLLMSIGIGRRLYDYGITVSRLYLLAFNLWCYGICLYLFATRSRRIQPIFLSFSLTFLIVSTGPWSFAALTRRHFGNRVQALWQQVSQRPELPMTASTFSSFLNRLSPTDRKECVERLRYLNYTYGRTATRTWITPDINLYDFMEENVSLTVTYRYERESDLAPIPSGYAQIASIDVGYKKFFTNHSDQGHIPFSFSLKTKKGSTVDITVQLPVRTLQDMTKKSQEAAPLLLHTNRPKTDVLLTGFDLSLDAPSSTRQDEKKGYGTIEGYVLVRK